MFDLGFFSALGLFPKTMGEDCDPYSNMLKVGYAIFENQWVVFERTNLIMLVLVLAQIEFYG